MLLVSYEPHEHRSCLCHSLVHIESWAIDLAWDVIARFGSDASYNMPREFFDDFVRVRLHLLHVEEAAFSCLLFMVYIHIAFVI